MFNNERIDKLESILSKAEENIVSLEKQLREIKLEPIKKYVQANVKKLNKYDTSYYDEKFRINAVSGFFSDVRYFISFNGDEISLSFDDAEYLYNYIDVYHTKYKDKQTIYSDDFNRGFGDSNGWTIDSMELKPTKKKAKKK